jgi:hypothetical protein
VPVTSSTAEERLAALAGEWTAAADLRGVFADCYRVMTHRLTEGVAAGDFHDGAWVARLRDRFADYYFDAVDAHTGGREAPCPAPWQVAFDACSRTTCQPMEALLLGINAHINHDLALALVDVLDDWPELGPRQRAERKEDHERVNDVIRATTDEVQREVVQPWSPATRHVDVLLGRVDEWVAGEVVERWRSQVWVDAMSLLAVAPEIRPQAADALGARAQRLATLIALTPG